MVAAAFLAEKVHGFSPQDRQRQNELLSQVGLKPLPRLSTTRFLEALKRDKKSAQGKVTFILPSKIGRVDRVGNVADKEVERALNYMSDFYNTSKA